jgi:hypothetical protein
VNRSNIVTPDFKKVSNEFYDKKGILKRVAPFFSPPSDCTISRKGSCGGNENAQS